MSSPVLPVGTGPQRSGSSDPVGSGCCFCRVILSCPEGSWPQATFLTGTECRRARKHPFSPQIPARRGPVSQQPLPAASSLSQAGCPQNPGPPETLSPETQSPKPLSPQRARNTAREGPVPEGRGGDVGG